jgi:SAM-dependent methyltransferase
LPFSDATFNVVTAVETHFWWPALPTDLREVLRVLKPGGRLIIIAEVYKGAEAIASKAAERYSERTGMALLSVEEHRELFRNTGYSDAQVIAEPRKGWICCVWSKTPSFVTLHHDVIASQGTTGVPIVSILPIPLLCRDLGARTRLSKDNRFRPTEGMEGRDPGEALVSE